MASLDIFLSSSKFLYFLLVLLAAGGWLFLFMFQNLIKDSQLSLNQYLKTLTIFAFVYAILFQFVDAIKFMGSLEGLFDLEIQKMVFQSHLGVSKIIAIFGLASLVMSTRLQQTSKMIVGILGITLIAVSFTYTGHTADNTTRIMLAPLLIVHIYIVMFWFGSLLPLYLVVKHENPNTSGLLIEDYSKKATRLVPVIFVSGIIMGWILMKGFNFFDHTYGLILLAKIGIFSALMLLAALNKWRFGPALLEDKPQTAITLQKALILEFFLVTLIVLTTAILTGYFSPGLE